MKTKTFWFGASFLLMSLFCLGVLRKRSLRNNLSYSQGYVTKVLPGGVTGGGIQFKFAEKRTKYFQSVSIGVECEYKIKSMLPEIKKIKFPIAFDSLNASNSEILLLKSQYEKYGLEVPKELKEIVEEISKCE